MKPRTYWNNYIERHGGVGEVAARLGIPYSTIHSVHAGHRGIGKKLAKRMVSKDPNLDARVLIFVTAENNHV